MTIPRSVDFACDIFILLQFVFLHQQNARDPVTSELADFCVDYKKTQTKNCFRQIRNAASLCRLRQKPSARERFQAQRFPSYPLSERCSSGFALSTSGQRHLAKRPKRFLALPIVANDQATFRRLFAIGTQSDNRGGL